VDGYKRNIVSLPKHHIRINRVFATLMRPIVRNTECAVYGSRPPIASPPGSSPPERPGLEKITSQPCSDATCPCNTASSTLSCLFQQKERDKAEVSTSRGGTGASCVRTWLTRDIV